MGTYALFVSTSASLQKLVSTSASQRLSDLSQLLENKFFNLLEMQDLEFNLKVVQMAQTSKPTVIADESIFERRIFSSKMRSEVDSIWVEAPYMHFPACLLSAISLREFKAELEQLIAYLKQTMSKKRSAETKLRKEQQQQEQQS